MLSNKDNIKNFALAEDVSQEEIDKMYTIWENVL